MNEKLRPYLEMMYDENEPGRETGGAAAGAAGAEGATAAGEGSAQQPEGGGGNTEKGEGDKKAAGDGESGDEPAKPAA
jgi:hypothetical protein